MPKPKAQERAELGDQFLLLAQALGAYRLKNRALLSKTQLLQLKELHFSLLNYADDFYTSTASRVLIDTGASLTQLKKITQKIKRDYHSLKTVQKAIDVAAAGVRVAASFFSRNPLAIDKSIRDFAEEWDKK